MKKTTTVAVITDHLSNGALIAEFRGTLTKLYPPRNGGSGDRTWTKRSGEMKDVDGQSIPVDFWDRDVPDSWKGRALIIQSTEGKKGTHGVTVFDDEYQGKTTRKLKITAAADVAFMEGGSSGGDNTAPRSEKPAGAPSGASGRPSGPIDLKGAILRRATVWNHCFDAAVATAHTINDRHGYAMVPAGISGLATTLYIETMRSLVGDLSGVDPKSIDWTPARGKTLKDHLSSLDRQVLEHREKQTPPAGVASPPPMDEIPLEERDEIPF